MRIFPCLFQHLVILSKILDVLWHVAPSLQPVLLSSRVILLCLSVCMCVSSPLLIRTSVIGFRTKQILDNFILSLPWLYLQRPYLRIRSHSKVLSIHEFLEGNIQPTIVGSGVHSKFRQFSGLFQLLFSTRLSYFLCTQVQAPSRTGMCK